MAKILSRKMMQDSGKVFLDDASSHKKFFQNLIRSNMINFFLQESNKIYFFSQECHKTSFFS